MEFLDEIIDLLNSGEFQKIIDSIGDFLDENPAYKTIDYHHFANPLEEMLFDNYLGNFESIKTLDLDKPLEDIYTIYSIAYMNLGQINEAEKYLKIANQINPVSAPILIRLCEFYQSKHEEEKLKDLCCDIFKYTYDVDILTSSYFKLADYLYHTNQNMELYNHLFNFFVFLKFDEEQKPVKEDIIYFSQNNIQVGVNPKIIQLLMYLIALYSQNNMLSSSGYFKNILDEVSKFNNYLNHLVDDEIDEQNVVELKNETGVDNSRLEELTKEEITPIMQIEFLNMLKESRLYMPVSYSENMFECIESAKVGDVIGPTVQIGFNIEFPFNTQSLRIESILDKIDKIIYENNNSESINNEEFQLIVYKTILPFFKYSMNYTDIGSFLIFYHINLHFLKLDISELLKIHNLNEQFKDFSNSLADFFKSLSIPILDIKNNRSFEFYSKIIETININETKSDISLLRLINMDETTYFTINSKLVLTNEIFSLILFFKNLDFDLFVKTMMESTNLFSSILFIKSCSIEELLMILQNNTINNEFIVFSSLKKILDKKYDKMSENKNLVKNILSHVYKQDNELFKKLIQIFDRNVLFNESVGLLIKEDVEIDIEFIINQFEISYFSQENDYRRKLLENYNRDEDRYFELLKICFVKHREHLDNLLNNDKRCIFLNYALTNLSNFILLYYLDCMDKTKLLAEINKTLKSIKYLNSEWFESITSYRNKFYVHYSNLLILSCAYHYNEMHDNETSELFEELVLDRIFEKMLYESDYDSLSTIKKVLCN